jgi:hypothetical protein
MCLKNVIRKIKNGSLNNGKMIGAWHSRAFIDWTEELYASFRLGLD